jgi:2-succinyl-5-enolpyruvyl-6-hydroxy-3-cyclohexene-1-carboxylate synthase
VSAVQTLWTEVLATALADAGVALCVVSPGSRSTPLVTALARGKRLELPVIVDERAAGFFALAAARSSDRPVALVCTSGSAPGHYLPAVIEAAMACVPLLVISADRPPELHDAGAAQTVPQLQLFGEQVRMRLDLGPPTGEALALRAVRRRVMQAVASALGPVPGPVHLNVPLRKPLEPAAPSNDAERALAAEVARIAAMPAAHPPRLAVTDAALDELAAALLGERHGMIVAGALPEAFAAARDDVFAVAARLGYPLVAEAGSQLRLGPRPAGVLALDHADLVLGARLAGAPAPRLLLQLGAEPAIPGWHAAQPLLAGASRFALGYRWQDPSSTARVLLGDPADALRRLRQRLEAAPASAGGRDAAYASAYAAAEATARGALTTALAEHPASEVTLIGVALRACVERAARGAPVPRLVLGNSLPVRTADLIAGQVAGLSGAPADERPGGPLDGAAPPALPFVSVVTQRGASGIDGQLAGACGAAHDGRPVLAIIGDVTFAHDAGSLQLLAQLTTPLALLVLDNGGGRIFDHLPVARAGLDGETYARFFTTPPRLEPVALARAFGVEAVAAHGATELAAALAAALAAPRATLIHAKVAADGALAVRTAALRGMQPQLRIVQGIVQGATS